MPELTDSDLRGFANVIVGRVIDETTRRTLRSMAHTDAFDVFIENLILALVSKAAHEAADGKYDGIDGYYFRLFYTTCIGEIVVDRGYAAKVADYARAALMQ